MSTITRRAFFSRAAGLGLSVVGLLGGCSAAPSAPTAAAAGAVAAATPALPSTATRPPAAGSAAVTAVARTAAPPPPTRADTSTAAATPAPTSTVSASGGPTPHLAVVRGDNPAAITRKAVEALGGIGQFVKPGQRVLIKPNICTPQAPEYAATTNPEVVATLVSLCKEAGAARVLVLDYPFGGNAAYRVSGIEAAVKAAGGDIEQATRLKFKTTPVPQGKDIKSWPIYEDALTYDVLINVPIAKNHNLATLTLSMKNLMGLVETRGAIHNNIGQRLAAWPRSSGLA